ncbi:28 kDa heat- and acid-stable phosphoprotein [Nilaparvata lugens]|uniref:28 kDa heat- and acid-stable phosphoprotein n=1 Tax=Nilaparvata lugens TaxID=108931 RepID=UPI00193EBC63|nr:28 kDa heat- and acid-stable phosphoprotein [Nilaparvata lugens]
MPRGKYQNHKGKNRRFTNPEELEEQRKREEKERQWRQTHGEESSSDEEEEDGAAAKKDLTKSSGSSESESESESDEEVHKAKGVENLIEVENPNRVQKKTKKSSALNEAILKEDVKPNLSRKEREELDRQRATQHYQKLHAEGKTDEARADLARLAIIKQQREEAAKQRDLEKQRKEVAKQQKTAFTQKALGKK